MTFLARAEAAAAAGSVLAGAVLARRRWGRHVARTRAAAPVVVRVGDGLDLHVEIDEEPATGPTVVLVHGLAARVEEFAAQRQALRGRTRCVLFDQRGHGRRGWRGYASATVDRPGEDLGEVLDRLTGNAPVLLVGHSMGGMSVLALAERRPELFGTKVTAVALLSTSAGRLVRTAVPGTVADALLRMHMARLLTRLVWFIAPIADRVQPFRRQAARRWLRRRMFGRAEPPEHVVREMEAMWTRATHTTVSAFYASLVNHDKASALTALRGVPTLVLAGTADATIPYQHSERIAHEIGESAELVLVPDAGHMVNMTHPDVVNERLLRLLERAG